MTWICLYSEKILRPKCPSPGSHVIAVQVPSLLGGSLLPRVKSPLLVWDMSPVLSGVNLSDFSGSVIWVWHCNCVIDLTL